MPFIRLLLALVGKACKAREALQLGRRRSHFRLGLFLGSLLMTFLISYMNELRIACRWMINEGIPFLMRVISVSPPAMIGRVFLRLS